MKKVCFFVGEINIICSDAGKSLNFYRDLLGFEVASEENGCWHLTCGKTSFLLLPVASTREKPRDYCSVPAFSIDLMVNDLNAAERYFELNGIEILNEPPPSEKRFFVRDPDNLVIEIIATSSQSV